jgi:hypothetical protein
MMAATGKRSQEKPPTEKNSRPENFSGPAWGLRRLGLFSVDDFVVIPTYQWFFAVGLSSVFQLRLGLDVLFVFQFHSIFVD